MNDCNVISPHESKIMPSGWQFLILIRALKLSAVIVTYIAIAVWRNVYWYVIRGTFDLERFGCLLTDFAQALGPAAIKVAQVASARADILPDRLVKPLARVQEMAKPISKRRIIKEFKKIFPNGPGKLFAT